MSKWSVCCWDELSFHRGWGDMPLSLLLFQVDFLTKDSLNNVLWLFRHHSPNVRPSESIKVLICPYKCLQLLLCAPSHKLNGQRGTFLHPVLPLSLQALCPLPPSETKHTLFPVLTGSKFWYEACWVARVSAILYWNFFLEEDILCRVIVYKIGLCVLWW